MTIPRRLPKLPQLLARKIYKTGQTRGADDDVIYQNRVSRASTVLIPYASCEQWATPPNADSSYANGFIVLISPTEYFRNNNIEKEMASKGLVLGKNAIVFYETREQWNTNNPDTIKWTAAIQRTDPLGGQYVARVPATTSKGDGGKIIRGFTTTSVKGAGIRVYEYASAATITACCLQLEALFWLSYDANKIALANNMTTESIDIRKSIIIDLCREKGLLDTTKLIKSRILNRQEKTVCPLCLEELSGQGFFSRMEQAVGRDVPDLTVTQINMFHIEELRTGALNHIPYNIGWGHHHCNVVVKDSGIHETLKWMREVLLRNIKGGYLREANSGI